MNTPVLLGRYQIQQELGRGGMGSVYKALDPLLGRIVAVKTIDVRSEGEELLPRLMEEAQAIAKLRHPNIVEIHDFRVEAGHAFIVMEYVEGMSLHQFMEERKVLDSSSAIPLLFQCASALDFAHSRGIVHRDVKPGNIMVTPNGIVKMLDWGTARLVKSSNTRRTQTGYVVGTVAYIAPEVLRGADAGPAADQFALATISYHLVTGRRPFNADDLAELMFQITTTDPIPARQLNPAISEPVEQALQRGLARDPGERFASCTEFIDAFWGGLDPPDEFTRMFKSVRLDSSAAVSPEASNASEAADRTVTPGEQTRFLRLPVEQRPQPDVLAEAQSRELIELAKNREYQRAIDLRGKWLPGLQGAPPELLGFSEAGRYLAAANEVSSPHNQLEHLNRALAILVETGNQLLVDASPLSRHLPMALETWKTLARELIHEASALAAKRLPNPFRAGQPLRPDQGPDLFRGRAGLVRQIESILADTNHLGSMALLGPRRCGKTSLLQMLPAILPDCICVFFDLQDNPVSSVAAFLTALSRQTVEQARRQRRVELPAMARDATFEAASDWLRDIDQLVGDRRVLICLDEFERLEQLFPGSQGDLLRLMGLLRATIQHRTHVRLLVSGVAAFEELGALWNDHFINVRELRIGHLDRANSMELLLRPIPEFPSNAVPPEVAGVIYNRTGGQPYLLQLYGSLLIGHLNEAGRSQARLGDVWIVEEQVMTQGIYYFRNTFDDAREDARQALCVLAREEPLALRAHTRRWLQNRWLIDAEDRLTIPVFGDYIREATAH